MENRLLFKKSLKIKDSSTVKNEAAKKGSLVFYYINSKLSMTNSLLN